MKDDFTFKITVIVEIPACDHEGKEYTCKDNGDGTHTVTCECGGIVDAEAAHSFITEVTRTEANCTEAGSVTKQCECGATETTELPVNADNHTGVNHTEKVKEATCTAEGYTGDTVCECGVTVKYGEAIEKKAHEFTVEQSKTLATCKEEGFIIWKCANCDATETETLAVDAANHTGVNHIENAKEATCTAEGYTGDTVCECGVTVADGEIIKMADHSFTVEQSKTEATCVAEGSILWKCANCDATETETLDMDPANHASEEFIYSDNEDGETHTKAHACCETVIDEEEAHVYVDGECVCGAVEPVKAITVIEKGGVEYEVVDNVVTVTRDDACKVGYWDAKNNKYVVIEAQPNEDGSYSFVAPEGVTEVLVVVKGDVNGDGKLNVRDITALSKSQLTETNENYAGLDEAWQQFAADVNGDGKLNVRDITALSKSQLTETNENYAALPW